MDNDFENIILDSDFIYGYFITEDANHNKSRNIILKYENKANFVILNITRLEIITLISRRLNQQLAKDIFEEIKIFDAQIIYVDEKMEHEIWEEFHKYDKKNISLVDCSNLVYARRLKASIASFDKFYPEEFLVKEVI